MSRAVAIAGLLPFAVLLGQAPAPTTPHADPALLEVQSLIDTGELNDAENAAREYLKTNPSSADAHYLLGYILFREGDRKSSLAQYTEGSHYKPPGALDLEVMGANYFLLEDYSAADQWFTRSVELAPRDVQVSYYLGRAQYNEKHFADAVRTFIKCLELDSHHVKAANYLGLSYEALGRTEDAIAAYRNAIAIDPAVSSKTPEPYLNLGSLLVENDRASDAVPYLVHAAGITPSDWHVHRALGKAYLQLNRPVEAVIELRKAVTSADENAPLHFLLAQALRKSGLEDQARAETERYNALTGAHSSPDSPLAEARSLVNLGKLDDAERVTRQYVELHKSSADGHYLLGYIMFKKQEPKSSLAEYTEGARYRKPSSADLEAVAGDYVLLKDYPDADKWFTKSVQWNPDDSLGWYYLGRTKYNENRFDEAVTAFERCLKLDPHNVKAEDNLGLSFEGLNQTDKAIAAYRTAIDWQKDTSDKDAGPLLDLGSLLMDNDRLDESLPYLHNAAQIAPGDYRVHRQLGKAYSRLNQLDQARNELEQAVKLAPQDAPVHFMLSQVYRKEGLLDKAKSESEQYTALTASTAAQKN